MAYIRRPTFAMTSATTEATCESTTSVCRRPVDDELACLLSLLPRLSDSSFGLHKCLRKLLTLKPTK